MSLNINALKIIFTKLRPTYKYNLWKLIMFTAFPIFVFTIGLVCYIYNKCNIFISYLLFNLLDINMAKMPTIL